MVRGPPKLRERFDGIIYALDCPGCGLSGREIPWTGGTDPVLMERFMIDGIERWREHMGFESIVLCGHSVGGYLAVCYAERYPSRIARLLLASPVGVPETPADWSKRMAEADWKRRLAIRLWEQGWSPFTIVRLGHRFGGERLGRDVMVKRWYVDRRYAVDRPWIDRDMLATYIFANMCGPSSAGNYAHAALLKPGAWAKRPLRRRIPNLRCKGGVRFVYGSHDWMGSKHAKDIRRELMVTPTKKKSDDDTKTSASDVDVIVVKRAGHNLMIDNPGGFVDALFAPAAASS